MSYADFLKAMTPYSYTEPFDEKDIEEYLKEHTPKILQTVDADKNGQISFSEFSFFLTLLQVQPGRLRRVFSKYPGKKVKNEDAPELMAKIRKYSSSGRKANSEVKIDARGIKASDEELRTTFKQVCHQLFSNQKDITSSDIIDL